LKKFGGKTDFLSGGPSNAERNIGECFKEIVITLGGHGKSFEGDPYENERSVEKESQ